MSWRGLDGVPEPAPDGEGLDLDHWAGLAVAELRIQCCDSCGDYQFPPEWICRRCHSSALTWRKVEPAGEIVSWTRVHHAVTSSLVSQVPYVVILVELDLPGRVRLFGNPVRVDGESIAIGRRVKGVFVKSGRGFHLAWVQDEAT